jgi:hypothetical protein
VAVAPIQRKVRTSLLIKRKANMEIVQQGSKVAGLLDNFAKLPPGAPFALTAPNGQTLFVGARMTHLREPALQGPAKTTGIELLEAVVAPFAAVLGLPVAGLFNLFRQSNTSDLSKYLSQPQPAGPAFTDFVADFQNVQAAHRAPPAKPPRIVRQGDTTLVIYDELVIGADMNLAGAVLVPQSRAAVPQPKTAEIQSIGRRLLADPYAMNELVNFLGEAVDTAPKFFPDLGASVAIAGDVVDVMAIFTSGAGILDAIHRGDKKALGGYSLTLGAGTLHLAGSLSGNSSLCNVAVLLKTIKGGWTLGPTLKNALFDQQVAVRPT